MIEPPINHHSLTAGSGAVRFGVDNGVVVLTGSSESTVPVASVLAGAAGGASVSDAVVVETIRAGAVTTNRPSNLFNKTDMKCPEFNQLLSEHDQGIWYKFLYGTGRVYFR